MEGFNIKEIIKRSCKDLLVKEYSEFIFFLNILWCKVNSIYRHHSIEDIDLKYIKDIKTMYIAFLIHNKDDSDERQIDLSSLRAYSSSGSIVDGKIARKDRYYCNFSLKIDEMHDTIITLKTLIRSEKGIKKFRL